MYLNAFHLNNISKVVLNTAFPFKKEQLEKVIFILKAATIMRLLSQWCAVQASTIKTVLVIPFQITIFRGFITLGEIWYRRSHSVHWEHFYSLRSVF